MKNCTFFFKPEICSSQDNERLVYRIQKVRKLLKRTRKEKKWVSPYDSHPIPFVLIYCRLKFFLVLITRFLIDRLDQHGDRWREAPMGVLEENSVFQATPKQEKGSKSNVNNQKDEKPKKTTKRKGAKADPNAPKRPANPFFQFCQEQRPRVMERLAGEPEPSKQELTRQLATTWKSLTSEDKKVKIKEKYDAGYRYHLMKNSSYRSTKNVFHRTTLWPSSGLWLSYCLRYMPTLKEVKAESEYSRIVNVLKIANLDPPERRPMNEFRRWPMPTSFSFIEKRRRQKEELWTVFSSTWNKTEIITVLCSRFYSKLVGRSILNEGLLTPEISCTTWFETVNNQTKNHFKITQNQF